MEFMVGLAVAVIISGSVVDAVNLVVDRVVGTVVVVVILVVDNVVVV
jgi:hypothetical protein